jgi:hypothetical protein
MRPAIKAQEQEEGATAAGGRHGTRHRRRRCSAELELAVGGGGASPLEPQKERRAQGTRAAFSTRVAIDWHEPPKRAQAKKKRNEALRLCISRPYPLWPMAQLVCGASVSASNFLHLLSAQGSPRWGGGGRRLRGRCHISIRPTGVTASLRFFSAAAGLRLLLIALITAVRARAVTARAAAARAGAARCTACLPPGRPAVSDLHCPPASLL